HLFEEPSSLLKQELREPANYFSVISAIAAGKTRLNEIATKSGIENTTCSKYLKTLLDLRIIERDVPISEKPQKNGVYKIADNCFRFWFRYVVKNMTAIEFGRGEKIWELIKIEDLSNYLGKTFEDICKQYIMLNYTDSIINKIGGWWGNNLLEKKQEEIDILAISSGGEAIFGECKWRNELLGEEVLRNLQRKANLFPEYDKKTFYLFSKSGFTDKIKELAHIEGNIILVGIEDLFA
ncbi:MAG: ATP-binding protein, partial [Peptostreptococcaceae bacterium]|nr:ATP-binding protein [Peptostreptococcaceae bacterium]